MGPYMWLMADLVLKFINCCYLSNRICSDTDITYTVKLADHKPVVWHKNRQHVSITSWVIANFHSNKDRSCRRLNDSEIVDHKTLSLVQNLGPILNLSWFIVNFVWKYINFRCHGKRDWSDTNFTHTVKLADHINAWFGAWITEVSYLPAEL